MQKILIIRLYQTLSETLIAQYQMPAEPNCGIYRYNPRGSATLPNALKDQLIMEDNSCNPHTSPGITNVKPGNALAYLEQYCYCNHNPAGGPTQLYNDSQKNINLKPGECGCANLNTGR